MASLIVTQLKIMLGVEEKDSWIDFMQTVEVQLPLLDKPGRPTKEEIAQSPIGEAGFSSWTEMVESKDGLNWSYNTWKSWKKAWIIVKRHPYLRQLHMTSSEINTIAKETDIFPGSLEALKAHRASRKETQANAKANSINALTTQLSAYKVQVEEMNKVLDTFRLHSESEARRFEEVQAADCKKIEDLRQELADTKAQAKQNELTLSTVQQKNVLGRILWAITA